MSKPIIFDLAEIVYLHNVRGVSFKIISDFYGCTDTTVARAFKVNGIDYKKISLKGKHIDNGIHKATNTAIRLGYDGAPQMIADLRMSGKTVKEVRDITGLGLTTIRRHMPENIKGMQVMTDKARERIRKLNDPNRKRRDNKNHFWRTT